MDIISLYKKRLTSDFIIRNIFNGTIPVASDIKDYLDSLNLEQLPLVNQFDKEFIGYSKSQDFNELLERVGIDINVAYDAIQEIAKENNELSNYILSKLDSYFIKLKQLNRRAENLLLSQYNSEGYFDFFYDDFDSIDNVDFTVTNAYVDVETDEIRVSKRVSNDLVKIDPREISFIPTSDSNTYATYELAGFSIKNLVDSTPTPWQYKIVTKGILGEVEGNIYIKFGRPIRGVHRIEIDDVVSEGAQNIGLEYSKDGLNFFPFNTGAQLFSTSGTATAIEFDVVDDLTVIKMTIGKRSYSYFERSGKPVYVFSLDEIRVYASGEVTLPGSSIYQSKPISIDGKKILKCSMDVCHVIPQGASIQYFVKGNDSEFIPISGANESEQKFPVIVDFDKNQSLLFSGYVKYSGSYVFEGSTSNLTYEIVDVFSPSNKSLDQMFVWKNILTADSYSKNPIPGSSPTSFYQRNGATTLNNGWLTNGSTYSCYFYVDELEGIKIDLKNTVAILDNKQITGQVFIKHGVHSFETSSSNWANIQPSTSTIVNLTDPITGFALNHKYLIEGIVGNESLATALGYKNRTTIRYVAARRASYASKYDFLYGDLYNKDNIFTVIQASNGVVTSSRIVVDNTTDSDSSINPSVLVEYKSGSALGSTPADEVIIRAVLTSSEDGATPSIDSILLKLGTVE